MDDESDEEYAPRARKRRRPGSTSYRDPGKSRLHLFPSPFLNAHAFILVPQIQIRSLRITRLAISKESALEGSHLNLWNFVESFSTDTGPTKGAVSVSLGRLGASDPH